MVIVEVVEWDATIVGVHPVYFTKLNAFGVLSGFAKDDWDTDVLRPIRCILFQMFNIFIHSPLIIFGKSN